MTADSQAPPKWTAPVLLLRTHRPRWRAAALAGTAGALAALLRLVRLGRSGDVFVDEIIYRDLGRSAASGEFPRTAQGPFFLHPPGFFYLEAGWGRLFGFRPDLIAGVDQFRMLNAMLAGGTAALLVLLVFRASGSLPVAGAVGAVFALDPFCIRQNDRVLMETAVLFWVLAGYLVLLPLTGGEVPAKARLRAIFAGLLFGAAVLTKDEAALVTILPLAVAALSRWRPRREPLVLSCVASAVPYGVYFAFVVAFHHFQDFKAAKSSGIARLLGETQPTGFNAHGAPSLTSRLLAEAPGYATTYALLLIGPLGWLVIRRLGGPELRLLGLYYGSAFLALGYALTVGTLEEQALYLLYLPTLLIVGPAIRLWIRSREERHTVHWQRTTAAVTAAALLCTATLYTTGRLHSDNGYAQLRAYLAARVPPGSAITFVDGSTELGISYWALRDRYRVGRWITPLDRARYGVHYVVVPWKTISQGYSSLTSAQVRQLVAPGRMLFSRQGSTYGLLALYWLPLPRTTQPSGRPGSGGAHVR
jgi:hypothetical protein